ncbi:MAG: hypothetical protein ACFN9G_01355 [Cardiobacterium sp.]
MSHTLNFEHCHLATGNNIRADNIALLLPENSLMEHYAALWQVAFADNKLWQKSLHLDQLGIPGVNGEADYPPGVCLWRITELSAFCRDVVAFWLLRRKTHGVQLAALLTDETPCYRATLLDEPEAGCDWRDEAFVTASFDRNVWPALRIVLADPAQEYRSDEMAELLVRDGRQHAADDELPVSHITAAINLLTAGQYRNGVKTPIGISDIVRSLCHMATLFNIAAENRDRAVAYLEQPRNRGIICQPAVHLPPEGEHVVDLLLQLRFEDSPGSAAAWETRHV